MKRYNLKRWFLKLLDSLTGVKYDRRMPKIKTIPKVFDSIKEQYEDAVKDRQEDIRRLYFDEGWEQTEIAKRLNMDLSQVNRFIRKIEKEEKKG